MTHALRLRVRGRDKARPKFYVSCSCGYRAAVRHSVAAAAEAWAWHRRKTAQGNTINGL